jgi:DNA (cytosine-5)-methyltransferase 1
VVKPLTFGSLFAGIGGFDIGFERAGMECRWQVENDPYCQRVLAKHWPDVRRHSDILTFPQGDASDWRVDCVVGGFPCQDISYAGNGAGLDGERSGLFYEAMRVVRTLEPKYVVLENVAALLTRGLPDVLGTLASLGFDAEWHCIPSAAIGAPHIRDRVFILAYTEGSVADTERPRLAQRQRSSGQRAHAPATRDGWWATEPDVGRVANGVPSRVDRLRGLGNAVVPQVAEWIGRQIVDDREAEG